MAETRPCWGVYGMCLRIEVVSNVNFHHWQGFPMDKNENSYRQWTTFKELERRFISWIRTTDNSPKFPLARKCKLRKYHLANCFLTGILRVCELKFEPCILSVCPSICSSVCLFVRSSVIIFCFHSIYSVLINRIYPNFLFALILTWYSLGLLHIFCPKFVPELWPLIYAKIPFPLNILRTNWHNFTKFYICIHIDKI